MSDPDIDLVAATMRCYIRTALKRFPHLSEAQAVASVISADQTPEGYTARNQIAIEQMTEFTLSEWTKNTIAEIQSCIDSEKRSALKRALDLRRYEAVDVEAFERHIRTQATRLKKEYGTPPDSSSGSTGA